MFRKTVPLALAMCAGLLTGCASDEVVEVTEGFFGAVAVDEPRAAVVAQDVLVQGGNAADAAVSAFFTLAVTLPSSAGLGANGSCVVFDPAGNRFEQLSFQSRPLSNGDDGIAVPLGPRAMFALHARYGSLPFGQLIRDAEQLARFGDIVSRRLAEDLARDGAVLREAGPDRSELLAPSGDLLAAGSPLQQLDLAATLSRLRGAGVGDLYSGQLAQRFIESAKTLGYTVDPARLRAEVPSWSDATGVEFDSHIWALAASRPKDQALLAKTLAIAFHEADWATSPRETDPLMVAEMSVRAANAVAAGNMDASEDEAERLFGDFRPGAERSRATPGAIALFGGTAHSGATSFTVSDKRGLSVGCALTMNHAFGTGKVLPEMGVLAAPSRVGTEAPLAAAVIAGNRNAWQVHMTAMAAGGRSVVSALAPAIARNYVGGQQLAGAVAAVRSHYDPSADMLYVEQGTEQAAANAAAAAGYRVRLADLPVGAVRLFRCKNGLPRSELDCGAADDPRGRGLMLYEAVK
ncbi:gamma-glutamyltransferase family protein [Nisaea acidiphila]|uniref:Gamma-glutamyltransferase family protein n=1 Tax=Nisaea acidiphila TaxID=1862145 RepID=A0A9J7AQL8_9PROT|nr:gamma-glutamyltransferase family protein [Nisaea acidiphila]UUX49178.1 gamma-glutamyltransferase family protein [Nisaea acidiphila]